MNIKSSAQNRELEDKLQNISQSYDEAMQTIQDLTNKSKKSEAAASEIEQENKKWNDIHEDVEIKCKLAEKEKNFE